MSTSSAEHGPDRPQKPPLERASLLVIAVVLLSLVACAARHRPAGATEVDRGGVPLRVQMKESEGRPRIALVARQGDPLPAVALVVSAEHGTAATALGALLGERLQRAGFQALRVRPHGLGVHVEAAVTSTEQGRAFVHACTRALAAPVTRDEVARAAESVRALGTRRWAGPADAEVASCSGDLGEPLDARRPDLSSAAGARELERWRVAAYAAPRVAFAALGPIEFTRALAEAVADGPQWPTSPELSDSWPDADRFGVDTGAHERRISVALRVPDSAAALVAAHALGEPESALALRVRALAEGWRLERVVGTTRPRGGCIRVDLITAQAAEPSASEIASIASVALLEAEAALPRTASDGFMLEHSVLSESDPRAAAGAAAWQALGGQLEAGPLRRVVAYTSPSPTSLDPLLLRDRVSAALQADPGARVELRQRPEPGQGEFWALLASPCGTSFETEQTAGALALLLYGASSRPRINAVEIEPWVTPDGAGLLAHSARLSRNETPDAQARRVGEALGRALTERVDGIEFTRARGHLLAELGPDERSGYWLALGAVSPGAPSWLEPRGTWRALNSATPSLLEPARRALLAGPLRLAVLSNESETQAAAAARGAGRWLQGIAPPGGRCPPARTAAVRPGLLSVETSGEPAPNAYIAAALPHGRTGLRQEALVTALMLNQEGGLLRQALRGISASARARVIGGAHAAALVVELSASADQLDAAVQQVRALLERVGRGAIPKRTLEASTALLEVMTQERAFDPRRRIVDLWRGQAPLPLDPATVADFQRAAFRPETLVVVTVKGRTP